MRCALCNRPMLAAAVFIGSMPVGPTCAKRAGLLDKARRNVGALRLSTAKAAKPKRDDPQTLDMLEDLSDGE